MVSELFAKMIYKDVGYLMKSHLNKVKVYYAMVRLVRRGLSLLKCLKASNFSLYFTECRCANNRIVSFQSRSPVGLIFVKNFFSFLFLLNANHAVYRLTYMLCRANCG